jgi:excisionase family DNA binding protein
MTSNPSQMLAPGGRDTTPDGEPKCENCSRAAAWVWTLDSDRLAQSCDGCRPANGVSRRPLDAPAAPSERPPLTVEQAAARENVSTRTVYRWITSGVLGNGAWKVGSAWRIDPAVLDARRNAPRPAANPKPRRRRPKPTTAPADGGWSL